MSTEKPEVPKATKASKKPRATRAPRKPKAPEKAVILEKSKDEFGDMYSGVKSQQEKG